MKNKFLTIMLFFAFLISGIQNVSAQYVSETEAMVLVQAEMQTIEDDLQSQSQTVEDKTPAMGTLGTKLEFLTAVNLRLLDGETVSNAIILGVQAAAVADYVVDPSITNPKSVTRTPLHQEIVDLLSL